jgi:cellulose synthase/poly-beta-1,6-N-acetylglucosamine synthase-like glycosyltransferase
MKVSILLVAWKEEHTVGKALESILNGYTGDFEVLFAIPDQPTIDAALAKANELRIADKVWISDMLKDGKPKGKPAEIAYLMDHAKGDFWILGDSDVHYGENVINLLLAGFSDETVMAVTGQPVSADPKDNMMGYFGHLLTAAAHHKRMIDLTTMPAGHGRTFVKKRPFFPVSGYLFALRSTDIRPPVDTLVEDAYISYEIHRRGGRIAYAPDALVYVKFPTHLADYYKQKKRSVGGYVQLWKYGFVTKENNTRSLGRELEYFWFPLRYARGLRELLWSLCLYPIRVWLWLLIFWERKVRNKGFMETWVRIESTK